MQAQGAPFPLLSDANGALRQELKIKGNVLGMIAGREVGLCSLRLTKLAFMDFDSMHVCRNWRAHAHSELALVQAAAKFLLALPQLARASHLQCHQSMTVMLSQ